MGVLFIEILSFGAFNYLQPTYNTKIINVTSQYQDHVGGYYITLQNHQATLDSTYAALTITSILNKTNVIDTTNVTDFVMSFYDNSTGMFFSGDAPSLSATYSAIGSLALLNELSKINSTKTITSVLNLQTNGSFFRDYNEINQSGIEIELNNLYEATFILNTLFTNKNDYYQAINRTKMLTALVTLQYQDGFKENAQAQVPNMRNAYYVSQIVANIGANITYFESLGFQLSALENWIDQSYTGSGFSYTQNSQPSVEGTSYALMSLANLGVSKEVLKIKYQNGINALMNSLGENYFRENNGNTLGTLSILLIALKDTNNLEMINRLYLDPASQQLFTGLIGITLILLLISIVLLLFQVLKEDESNYYETALKTCVHEVYDSHGDELHRLSYLLGDTIEKVSFVFQDTGNQTILRAQSKEHEFVIVFETFSWLPRELTKYDLETHQALLGFNFLVDDVVLYTIEEALEAISQS